MANPYQALFNAPGSRAFVLAGMVARMPISMTGIGLITMLSQLQGGYGLAGSVAATFALATAFCAPQVSRMVDRFGQGRVLPVSALVGGGGLLLLLLCTRLQAPNWTLFVFAALAGCMPNMSAMVRARWTELYRGQPQLQTAYALESVLDEVCFIVGPPLSVGLCVVVFPEAGPLVALLMLAIGVSAFVLQRSTEPSVHPHDADQPGSVVGSGDIRLLMLLMGAMGTIVGVVDVVSVAFAQQQGQPAAASIVLSVYAIGSCLAGLAFGALKPDVPLPRLFLYGGVATALTTLPLLLAGNILGLSLAVFVAGLFFAPTLIVAMGLVERIVPPAKLTEGLTWLITGLSIGVAIGAAGSGWLVDAFGARSGFWLSIAAGAVVLGSAIQSYRRLK
ncbi:MFS transporter [Pseudomonas sp. FW306-02-F02-AA]|uniref:MFS transporter n=1 Tax=Pseudomonas fluorescens TaxID=294 RepID=A0A0N9VRW4_PSEFL|nr:MULTISPECIES: MFS transporter [Pseudomonas]ALI03184.1 MFS transporter [Pseudomonas fluorescens]PMZ01347.1 MFS transporter [Pseudomonas sp. FW306-02-F02-AB]PMZ07149.1 MFS transporter [Pseudomonas sp. FW306-02-H06C]PMZ12888.1 MFS transporter [Pseudomonas sp. FW306-02-F02-AA]PMZ18751.1 MFS transporter [Pseudomonas sp. FW306-02-F08-AA]